MENNKSLSPKFFFLSLGTLASLITVVSSSLILLFQVLNSKFPDALSSTYTYGYNTYDFEGIRNAIATLIIVFPVFILLSYFWNKISKEGLGKSDETIRKWMIYLVLFLASIVIITDLVTLVRYFVSGEITIRFILKVLGTLIVALISGSYYLFELNSKINKTRSRIYAIVSAILIILLIVFSFCVVGSPSKQRAWRLDERRVGDLQSIQYQIINYWQQKEKLPENLSDISNPISGYSIPVDPEFKKGLVYEYFKNDKLSFELCATFQENMPKGWSEDGYNKRSFIGMDASISYPYNQSNESWDHEIGRTCFERTIDKDIYPPFPKPDMN